jgi:hypothetical protein
MPTGGQTNGPLNSKTCRVSAEMEYLALLFSLPFLYVAFQHYRDARYIQNMPTVPIASAAQGLVEIKGKTIQLDKQKRYVPIINVPCVWYRYEEIMIIDDDDEQVTEVKTSDQRFYVADQTGVCAVDPMFADVHPKKSRDIKDEDRQLIHRVSWIGLDENLFVLGWLSTLHPAARTDDVIGEPGDNKIVKRYGQLQEQLNRITHAPRKSLPYIISSHFEHRLVNNLYRKAHGWLFGFFILIAILFALIQNLHRLY